MGEGGWAIGDGGEEAEQIFTSMVRSNATLKFILFYIRMGKSENLFLRSM